MRIGILGLASCGKSTVFDILVGEGASTSTDSTGSRLGSTKVPDRRIDELSARYKPKKTIYAQIDLVDFAAVRKGKRPGETFNAQFLGTLRTMDALLVVTRSFRDEEVYHPENRVDGAADAASILTEFVLADMAVAENRAEKLRKNVERGVKDDKPELDLLERLLVELGEGRCLRDVDVAPEEEEFMRGYAFLSRKPTLFVVNQDEEQFAVRDEAIAPVREAVAGCAVFPICAAIEKEIAALDPEDRDVFLSDLGLEEPARDRLIQACFRLQGLISFFTVGEDEVRAWTLREGKTAVDAAGRIHTDLARCFIRAEVFTYDDLIAAGSEAELKKLGQWRLEAKTYPVKDGDIVHIRANC